MPARAPHDTIRSCQSKQPSGASDTNYGMATAAKQLRPTVTIPHRCCLLLLASWLTAALLPACLPAHL
jgi:hypothetical protein